MKTEDEALVESSSVPVLPPEEDEHAEASARHARNVLAGTLLALVSAVLYTLTNMCLRAAAHCDMYWVSLLKAVPTFVIAAAIVASRRVRGVPNYPGRAIVVKLLLTGLLAHIGGNVAFQYGISRIGLAAAVPLTFSTIIVMGSLLGRFYLGEGISLRSVCAMGLLCVSIGLLGWHTSQARPIDPAAAAGGGLQVDAWQTVLAVAATCFSGAAYSVLGVVIRRNVTGNVHSSVVLLIISISGMVSLGAMSVARLGWSGLAATTPGDLGTMLLGGLFNAGGFFLLTRALQLIPVAYVNVVNASQTAMAALAGVLYFGESSTAALFAGVGLMTLGIVFMDRPKHPAKSSR
ncbi:MAG: DMT family transporter [Pirellulales bacterium]